MVKVRLQVGHDGKLSLWHDGGRVLEVATLHAESEEPPIHAHVASGVLTQLSFPAPEHDWVEISTLGDLGRQQTWICSGCSATRVETPGPRAPHA